MTNHQTAVKEKSKSISFFVIDEGIMTAWVVDIIQSDLNLNFFVFGTHFDWETFIFPCDGFMYLTLTLPSASFISNRYPPVRIQSPITGL